MNRWLTVVIAAALLVGCGGGGGSGEDEGDLGNAGSGGKGGSGGSGGQQEGGGLEINAALGLDAIDHPWDYESNLGGLILIQRDGEDPIDGAVEVNGVKLEEDGILTGFFSANGANVPGVGAGKTLSIRASDAKGSESLDVECPAEVQVTSPAIGAQVTRGQKIKVEWSGDLHKYDMGFFVTPGISFYRLQDFSNRWSLMFEEGGNIPKGSRSFEVTIPDIEDEKIVLELSVPGEFASKTNSSGGEHAGLCWLRRRVELNLR